jgi:hypothetical protein
LGDYGLFRIAELSQYAGLNGQFYDVGNGGAIQASGYGAASFDASGAAAARQANLSLVAGTYADGDMCTYASSETLLNCNTAIPSLSGALLATGATPGATSQAQVFTDGIIPSNLTVGYVPYAESTDKKLVNSPLYTDGTNFGLGTTSPGTPLDIFNISGPGLTVRGYAFGAANGNAGEILLGGSPAYQGVIQYAPDTLSFDSTYDNAGAITQFRMRTAGTPVTAMTILGSGNVSIGDATATSMFNVGTANQFQVSSTGVFSAGAGSTVYSATSSAQEAICLADGTGGGVCRGSIPLTTVSGLPTEGIPVGDLYLVGDGTTNTDCTTGGGSPGIDVLCRFNGSTWVAYSAFTNPAYSPTNHFTSNAFGVCYTNGTGLLVHVHITTISSPADTTTIYVGNSCSPSPSTPAAAQSQVGGSGEVSTDIPPGVSYEATNDGSGTLVTWLEVY